MKRYGIVMIVLALVLGSSARAIAHEGHGENAEAALARMTAAGQNFLASLSDDQKGRTKFAFDDEKRFVYRIIPFSIPGIQLGEMTRGQLALFHAMLSSGLSAAGHQKAASIIALEEVLVAMETANGRVNPAHGSDKYSIAVFGDPSPGGTWAWRVHGHHLYLTFTVVEGRLFASGPAFMGAEPHRVAEGPHQGWRVLGDEEDLGRALMESLSAEERAAATLAETMPRDLFSGNYPEFRLEGPPKGVAYAALGPAARQRLRDLVGEYVGNLPEQLAASRMDKVEAGGWENIHFAWIGGTEPGARNYYRVQGPKFLIEYCAVALTPNHVHTVWREFDGDFGRDLLAEHYRENAH